MHNADEFEGEDGRAPSLAVMPVATSHSLAGVGVVAIGRNEGERLKACLRSITQVPVRVYVDSGSTDGSQQFAREIGFDVVELAIPPGFTAARARNEGFARLLKMQPDLRLVQMIDGDCEMTDGWLETAVAALDAEPDVAIVFGRVRERYPDASVYNRLCDEEWNVPVGEADSCGGIAMFRVEALAGAGGYSADLIAGEEPDLCLRVRRSGWRIWRIDAEMTKHDAAITRFGQWWRRTKRSGHAFAELVYRHGGRSNPRWAKQVFSMIAWGLIEIAALAALAIGTLGLSLPVLLIAACLLLLLGLQVMRLALRRSRSGTPLSHALPWAYFLVLGKLPQLQGLLQYHLNRLSRSQSKLIEYKG